MAKKYQEAISVCEEALRKNPKDASAYENLSWALNALGRHPEALEASDRAIAIKASAGAYNNRGWAFQAMGHFSPALQAFEKALAIDQRFAPACNGKGDVYSMLPGQEDRALAAYEQALFIDPGFVPAYKGKGKVLQRQGKLTEAQQAFEQAQHLERSKQ